MLTDYQEHVEFLEEYNRWVAEKKLAGTDLSPEAFMLDRAKSQALEQLIKIEERIKDPGHPDELAVDIAEILGIELEHL